MAPSFRNLISRATRRLLYPITPKHLRLPFLFYLTQFSTAGETVLNHLEEITETRINAIDIGSNIGIYSYAMSKKFDHVYSFEINPDLTHLIKESTIENIDIYEVGLSSQSGWTQFYVPKVNGRVLHGWGSLDDANCPDAENLIEIEVQIDTLDSFNLEDISFIKIDVEGHEVEVIEGATVTIRKYRPNILVEIKDQNKVRMSALVERLGYQADRLIDVLPLTEGSPEDHILVPKERAL